MKFRSRPVEPEIIEAEQFRARKRPYPAALQRVWVDKRDRDRVLSAPSVPFGAGYEQKPKKPAVKGYAVKTPGGEWWVVHDGDWIFAENGGHYAYSDARIHELYEPVTRQVTA